MTETFIGQPCKICGSTLRYAKEKRCVKCRRTYDKARNKTPERRARDNKRWREDPKRQELQVRLRADGYHNRWQKNAHVKDPRRKMLTSAKQRAAAYGREFRITLDDIVIPLKCPLLGIPIVLGNRRVKNNSPTIDRKNSAKGYIPKNIWVISWRANRIKYNATLKELKLIVKNWP
jgi:hypothetical protein